MPGLPLRRYVIMPKQGFENVALESSTLMPAVQPIALTARVKGLKSPSMRVLDSIGDTGPNLVEIPAEGELSFRLSNPDLKIVPEVIYHRLWYWPNVEKRPARKSAARKPKVKARGGRVKVVGKSMAVVAVGSTLTVVDDANDKPLRGAHVVVFTDYQSRTGDEGDSSANGVVRLNSISARQALERDTFMDHQVIGATTQRALRSQRLRRFACRPSMSPSRPCYCASFTVNCRRMPAEE
jgi:subtilisin